MATVKIGDVELPVVYRNIVGEYFIDLLTSDECTKYEGMVTDPEFFEPSILTLADGRLRELQIRYTDARIKSEDDKLFFARGSLTAKEVKEIEEKYKLKKIVQGSL